MKIWSCLFLLLRLLCCWEQSLAPSPEFATALWRDCLRSCAILKHGEHWTLKFLVFLIFTLKFILLHHYVRTRPWLSADILNQAADWMLHKQLNGALPNFCTLIFRILTYNSELEPIIIQSPVFLEWATDLIFKKCCHATSFCCFIPTNSPPSLPGFCREQKRWGDIILHNCDLSSWLNSSPDCLEGNTFQIFGWMNKSCDMMPGKKFQKAQKKKMQGFLGSTIRSISQNSHCHWGKGELGKNPQTLS